MSDKNYKELFTQYVSECLAFLRTLPNFDPKCLQATRKRLMNDRDGYLGQTVATLTSHIELLAARDVNLFSDDYLSNQQSLQLLPGLDFRRLWPLIEAQGSVTVTTFFKIMQMIFIYGSSHLKQNKQLIVEMVETMKMESNMETEIAKAEKREAEAAAANSLDFSSLFGDHPIASVMTELLNDPDIHNLLMAQQQDASSTHLNPIEAIGKLFQPGQMDEFMDKFKNKFFSKLAEKGFQSKDLEGQLRQMNESMMAKLGKHKIFRHIKPHLENMMNGFINTVQGGASPGSSASGGMEMASEQLRTQMATALEQISASPIFQNFMPQTAAVPTTTPIVASAPNNTTTATSPPPFPELLSALCNAPETSLGEEHDPSQEGPAIPPEALQNVFQQLGQALQSLQATMPLPPASQRDSTASNNAATIPTTIEEVD